MTYELLHPQVIEALEVLSNENRTDKQPLIKGQAAGIRDLDLSQFPPRGIHRNNVPARFTFDTGEGMAFELHLMVDLISYENCGEVVVLGFLAHDQADIIFEGLKPNPGDTTERWISLRWIAVKYSLQGRTGFVYLSGAVHTAIRLYQRRMRANGNHRAITFTIPKET